MSAGLGSRVAALLCAFVFVACNSSSAAPHADAGDAGRGDGGKSDGGRASSVVLDAGPADDTMPAASSEELTARARHLLEAIAADNPELATDITFPREGYLATRDVGDPTKAWEKMVKRPFDKTVHKLHKKKGVEHAQFVSFELGHAVVQSGARRGGWKKPLWVVRHSKLTYTIDGKQQRIDVSEMTAWRGAWYVTRLR